MNPNPPMTPLDQTLVDQMKSALSKSAPDVCKNIGTVRVAIGDGVVASHVDGDYTVLTLSNGLDRIEITPEMMQNLERFLEQIGWRCS